MLFTALYHLEQCVDKIPSDVWGWFVCLVVCFLHYFLEVFLFPFQNLLFSLRYFHNCVEDGK